MNKLWSCIILFSSFGAMASPCDCPEQDELAGGGACSVKPAWADNFGHPYSDETCELYNSPTYKTFVRGLETALESRPEMESLNTPSLSKQPVGLLNYLSCYRADDKTFCHFKKSLAPYVMYSAKLAGVPYSVQACLFFKESMFKPKAASGVGAVGYIQFMPQTFKDLQVITSKTGKEWDREISKHQKRLTELLARKDLSSSEEKSERKSIDADILKARTQARARRVWDVYWKGTEAPPKSITTSMASCYRTAFVLAAMKQTLDAGLMSDDVEEFARTGGKVKINGMNEMDSAIFLAGAYNGGGPGLVRKCGDKNLKECIESFPESTKRSKSETREHMQGIRNCAQAGSLAPTQDPYEIGTKRKSDCETKRCFE